MESSNNFGVEIVITPTFDWLADKAAACKSRMLIGSPYVNNAIVSLTNLVPSGVKRTLITKTNLRDFSWGSSSLDSIRTLASNRVSIYRLDRLHAKVYIFDDDVALVTSANATFRGLRGNLECGLATRDGASIEHLAKALTGGLGAEHPPYQVSRAELDRLRIAVSVIRPPSGQPVNTDVEVDDLPDEAQTGFFILDEEALLNGLHGWLRLTMRGVLEMPIDGFGQADLMEVCAPRAAIEYPRNRHVDAKLRQQLQYLRDLGLVEFMQPGRYRCTMNRLSG